MATIYFVGNPSSTTADFSSATQYNTQPDGSGSTGLPTAGDTLIFAGGTFTITAGFTGLSAVALAAVYVMPGCQVSTSAGNSLTLDVSSGSGFMSYAGRGGLFSVTAGSGGIDKLHVFSTAGQFRLVGGTTAILGVFGGGCYVDGSAVVTTAYLAGGFITAETNATAFTTVDMQAGKLETARTITTLQLTGSGQAITRDAAAITTANISGGVLNYRSRGTLGTCNLRAGELTPAGAITNPTITTLNVYGTNATTKYVSQAGSTVFNATPTYLGSATAVQVDQPGV